MTSRVSTKLTLTFGILFTLVFMVSSFLVLRLAETLIYDTIDSSLDSTADLIKRIVQVSIENNRGQVAKDIIVAEHFMGTDFRIDPLSRQTYKTYNTVTQQYGETVESGFFIGGQLVSVTSGLVDRISLQTGSIITVYQATNAGFLSISTTKRLADGTRYLGELIPSGSSIDTLIRRTGIYYGRDYFNKRWYLTAYKLVYSGEIVVGALYAAIEQTDLYQLRQDILSIQIGKTGFPYIIDTLSAVVIHPTLEGKHLFDYAYIKELIFLKDGHIIYTENDPKTGVPKQYISYFKYVPEMNWIVVVGSARDDFFGALSVLRFNLLLIFTFALASSLGFTVLLGRSITRPITTITRKFREISEGEADLSRRLYIKSNDEIEDLAIHFNLFLDKLRTLKDIERRSVEVSLKDAQINALQAQINPHFLYNTLETIHFMITLGDPRSSDMVLLLADLFRISIGKGERYVTIRQELEHVQLFVSIQKMRYPGRFVLRYSFTEEILDLYTIKFLLQPIIENSIHHGFGEIEQGGVIDVSGAIESGKLVIRVEDNGAGLDSGSRQRLQNQLNGIEEAKSIGLPNVHERITLHFGEAYGVSIDWKKSEGVAVCFTLPILKKEPTTSFAILEVDKIQF